MKDIKSIFREIFMAMKMVLDRCFPDESSYVSKDMKMILSHPEDRLAYFKASDKLCMGSLSETFILHTGAKFTITR